MRCAPGVLVLGLFACAPPAGALECGGERDCKANESCVNGACMPRSGGLDAATDAGPEAGDGGRPDADTGVVESCETVMRVSVGLGGGDGIGDAIEALAISAEGRFVAFGSDAPNLVAADRNNATDVFVRDVTTGTTARVSVSSAGVEGNGPSGQVARDVRDLSISADGRFVVFSSLATNLIDGTITPGPYHLYLHDRREHTTEVVDVTSDGRLGGAGAPRGEIDGTGRFIVFQSVSENLGPGTMHKMDIFIRDRLMRETVQLTDDSDTFMVQGFSDDARFILGTEGSVAFVHDRTSGSTSTVSISFPRDLSISNDGRFIAFATEAKLVAADTNPTHNLYLLDRNTGTPVALELDDRGGMLVNQHALDLTDISADGSRVAFSSYGPIDAIDQNDSLDVYVFHRSLGRARLISRTMNGQAAGDSTTPALSSDGRWVAFRSTSGDLVSGDENRAADIFIRRVCDP